MTKKLNIDEVRSISFPLPLLSCSILWAQLCQGKYHIRHSAPRYRENNSPPDVRFLWGSTKIYFGVRRFGYGKCWINNLRKSHTTILKICQSSKEQPLLRRHRSNTTRNPEKERRPGGRMSTLQRLMLVWRQSVMKLSKGMHFLHDKATYNFTNTSQWYNQREAIGRPLYAGC